MSKQDKSANVWVSVEDLTQDPEFLKAQGSEFSQFSEDTEEGKESPSRRDFLKYVGFGIGAATLASCEIPVKRAIPYVVKPEEIVPGVATYYASTFVKGGDCVPVLIKTREGRPIKTEGHPMAFTQGGTSARSQASILDLYDTNRAKGPMKISNKTVGEGEEETTEVVSESIDWDKLDKAIKAKLNSSAQVRILTHTNMSPTFKTAVAEFASKYPNTKHVQYDPFSSSAILQANKAMYQKAWIPNYRFDKAKCVVGIDCDFLGTWVSPIEFAADYIKNRKANFSMKEFEDTKGNIADKTAKNMSVHIQFEGQMSLTGSNADHRVLIKPSEQAAAVKMLFNEVAKRTGNGGGSSSGSFQWKKAVKAIQKTAEKLVKNAGKGSLVVCGINDVNIQKVVNGINEMLGAYGKTILWSEYSKQRQGSDKDLKALVSEMGSIDALFVLDANPAYDIPGMAADFAKGLKAMTADEGKLTVSMAGAVDETAALCQYLAPDHNYLESWGDANPKQGHYFLVQPTIKPIFKTRAAGHSFLTWADKAPQSEQPYYEFLKNYWKEKLYPLQNNYFTAQGFWDNVLHDGMFMLSDPDAEPAITAMGAQAAKKEETTEEENNETTSETNEEVTEENTVEKENENTAPANSDKIAMAKSAASSLKTAEANDNFDVVFYETVTMGAGQYANNPWLQEMPDPVMRTTWDNFIAIPITWDGDNNYVTPAPFEGVKDGDIVEFTVNGNTYKLPVVRQFGLHKRVVAINLGYGRKRAGMAGTRVGVDFFPECKDFNYYTSGLENVAKIGRDGMFACVQLHHTYGLNTTDEQGKLVVDESTGKPFNVDEQVLGHRGFQGSLTNRSVFFQSPASELKSGIETLRDKRKEYQHLNEKGLYPSREETYGMGHWWSMSVDLNSCIGCGACTIACVAENNVPVVGKFEVSKAHEMTWLRIDRYFYGDEDTPNTAYMPMMCQHCDNAPCENVCPVAATNHSSEGLNQMTYNRCIGTRYCANNCPYKVRRFNWLDYTSADLFPSNSVNMNRGMENDEFHMYMNENLTRMVLNPDVTVRSRGVIEKCSFCVQRIQEGKLTAKVENRRLKDGEIKTACQTACPTGAITFGDRNDKKSEVVQWMESARGYLALEEVNVRSSVTYLMKVMNRDSNFLV